MIRAGQKKWMKQAIGLALGILLVVGAAGVVSHALGGVPRARAYPYPQPPIPHPVEGREDCLACHRQGGVKAVPASHASFTNQLCTSCHRSLAVATPAPTSTPTAGPPTTGPAPTPTAAPLTPVATPTQEPPSAPTPPPASPTPTATPTPLLPTGVETLCLVCHANPGPRMSFQSGEVLSLFVDIAAFRGSVHGSSLTCTNCHRDRTSYPHPKLDVSDKRGYELVSSKICLKCHASVSRSPNEAITDRVHAKVQRLDRERAPTCIDCHSPGGNGHDIAWAEEAQGGMAQMCARCHEVATDSFALAITGHEEPSASSSPAEFFVDRFFLILTTVVLAFGILHVELDLLHWFATRRKGGGRRE